MHDAEPGIPHEPAPQAPQFVERKLPLCPTCSCLMRRDLSALTGVEAAFGPWRCDLHGEATPVWETTDVPTGEAE